MNDGLRNRARHGRGREGKEGGRTTTAGSTTVAAYPSTRYQLRACFRPKIKDFELFRVRLLPQGAATSCSSVMSPTLISSGHRAARRPLRSPFSLPPRWHCRPVTRFDCHSSPARAPARRPPPVASSARPPPSFLLGISSAAATGGGGEKKRSVEMRLCARPPRRPLAFWDDNYGSNYNEFVPDSGRGTEWGGGSGHVAM